MFNLLTISQARIQFYSRSNILFLLIAPIILIGFFLLVRELVMWYWKVNRRIELLEEQNQLLREIVKQLNKCKKES